MLLAGARRSKKHAEMIAHLRAALQQEEGCADDFLQGYNIASSTGTAAGQQDQQARGVRGKKAKSKRKQQMLHR